MAPFTLCRRYLAGDELGISPAFYMAWPLNAAENALSDRGLVLIANKNL